ncbi:MAG TPA: indolepyruvate ferredoxin oxidoreductase family protein [Rhabdaerophilum sp.]|nr:indolepyruvate ferredoxin oxidoreductase family protein [Rhabdaerophilum sp.]
MQDRSCQALERDVYRLEDRYKAQTGRIFMTGTQALVRILLDQARRDRAAGFETAGLVSGYRGSPLGAVDQELWRAKALLADNDIEFLPAVNEDLAATAVLGSQQVETQAGKTVQGVFGLWYGKGPGVDRAGDALKHGNAYGASPHGGVLVVAGDDHGCVSSSMPHQSDVAFMSFFMPTLNPASVAEYLEFGAYGYALSRFSGMWVGFKAISETVESATSFDLPPERRFILPDFETPPGGLHYRWPDLPGPQIETRMEAKKHAVYAFARANPIDRKIYDLPNARYGIVTTGKGHLDLMEALRLIGLDETACRRLGIDIYKVGMVWPLPLRDALGFVHGKQEILVVEEKRGIIESQLKEYFYDAPEAKPERMVGKHDEFGNRLVPWIGELTPRLLAPIIAGRLHRFFPEMDLPARAEALKAAADRLIAVPGATRTPYFCSGCPHNTSTKVPEGSKALAGIGCHFMASWMDRETSSLIQMGGEGVNWAASSRFTGRGHIFQNLGEGTWYHSGSMAIRQAIATQANITYKILFNDAVAMTGGQPVDGPISVPRVAHAVRAEGVERIALVSDAPETFNAGDFPPGTTFHPRGELNAVQCELREIPGVTVLIYAQTCATEKRRRRKRGLEPASNRYAVINDLVCEGCGDCSVQSNCLSVEPKETPLGRKRKINLSNCNQDFACLDGFCPSFVTIEGGKRRRNPGRASEIIGNAELPHPVLPSLAQGWNVLIAGVGGTGVITVGAVAAMAAHLDGRGVSVLDFTGFAQKFGPVLSYLRLSEMPETLFQPRIDQGAADALIGCDMVVSSSPKASGTYRFGTRALLNTAEVPTGDVVRHRDADLARDQRLAEIARVVGGRNLAVFDANALAEDSMGDAVFANMILLGAAWQLGLLPLSLASLEQAIALNGVAVEQNRQAFALGRVVIAAPERLRPAPLPPPDSLNEIIARRADFLTAYQNESWAKRYCRSVARVRQAEAAHGTIFVTEAVARALFRLMSYKDEYEVARLHAQTDFLAGLDKAFEGDFSLRFHLAPPLLSGVTDHRGRPRKRSFGRWIVPVFKVLARLKPLRGTPFDPFGWTAERRMERHLIVWYESIIGKLVSELAIGNPARLMHLAKCPDDIRGFGPVKREAVEKLARWCEEQRLPAPLPDR